MFEHIHLLSGPEEVYMKEDTTDPLYRTFQREIRMCCAGCAFSDRGQGALPAGASHEPGGSGVSFLSADLFSYGDGRRLLTRRKDFASCLLLYTYEGKGNWSMRAGVTLLRKGTGS